MGGRIAPATAISIPGSFFNFHPTSAAAFTAIAPGADCGGLTQQSSVDCGEINVVWWEKHGSGTRPDGGVFLSEENSKLY